MADAHSTPRERGRSARRGRDVNRTLRAQDRPRSQVGSSARRARRAGESRPLRSTEIVCELEQMALTLGIVYSTCVVAELALQGQKADRDMDVLAALRHHVSRPVIREVERLLALAAALRRRRARFAAT